MRGGDGGGKCGVARWDYAAGESVVCGLEGGGGRWFAFGGRGGRGGGRRKRLLGLLGLSGGEGFGVAAVWGCGAAFVGGGGGGHEDDGACDVAFRVKHVAQEIVQV